MRANLLIIGLFLIYPATVHGQINIEGSKVARQKETITLTVKHKDVLDLKINCFPKNKSWKLSRNYDDPTIIEINFTPTADGIYYFIASGNKDNKTEVGESTIAVGDFIPTPPVIPPTPTNPYKDSIESSYMVSPDKDSLTKLIKVYKEIQTGTYASWETCQLDLRAKIEKEQLTDKLSNVKKEVIKLLTADSKDVPYTNDLKTKLFTQVTSALEGIK